MYCSNCGNLCGDHDQLCSRCGSVLYSISTPKRGTFLVPVLIMVLLCIIGITLFFAIPLSDAPGNNTSDNSWFHMEGGVLCFDQASYTGPSELIVPNEIAGQPVTALSEGCFENCRGLTSVVLPDSLETIGKGAFRNCTALRGIEIPESVAQIEEKAFSGCSALEAICISDSCDAIGPGAFDGCNKLRYIMFLGTHRDWVELYDEFIAPYTSVFCDDGTFYQGGEAE